MSQHIYRTHSDGELVEVQMGWDKPCGWFYLVISPVGEGGETEDPVYSNLDEENPATLDLDYFLGVLDEFGIVLPDGLVDEVRRDRLENAVNRVVVYQ